MHLVRSAILGSVKHGFSTRQGGVSTGRFASLNLGSSWGDEPAAVLENKRRLAAAGGFDVARLTTVKQVHGARCLTVPAAAGEQADALVTTTPGEAVAVFTADCVPVLLSDGAGGVAAAHAGWRGLVAGVLESAVSSLVAAGGRARGELRAAIGPSIGPCCFEVGDEVAAQFDARVVLRSPEQERPKVDLWRAATLALAAAGIADQRVETVARCSRCEVDWFYSYRRDGAGIGQMLSFIVAGPL